MTAQPSARAEASKMKAARGQVIAKSIQHHIARPETHRKQRPCAAPGIACAPSGSKIGPGEVNSRANEPGDAATKPPNGGADLCRAGEFGFAQHRQPRQRGPACHGGGSSPQALGIGGGFDGLAQHTWQPREQDGLAQGGSRVSSAS